MYRPNSKPLEIAILIRIKKKFMKKLENILLTFQTQRSHQALVFNWIWNVIQLAVSSRYWYQVSSHKIIKVTKWNGKTIIIFLSVVKLAVFILLSHQIWTKFIELSILLSF